jgi:hypothetical protein
LNSKPGQEKKDKPRGELEVRTAFIVKAGSLTDLSKKDKNRSSLGNLPGGSLLSLGTIEKRKTLKKFAKSLSSKIHVPGKKKKENLDDLDSYSGSFSSIGTPNSEIRKHNFRMNDTNADPGVISEDEDEFVFDNLSHKSSASSLNSSQKAKNDLSSSHISALQNSVKIEQKNAENQKVDEWEAKLYGKNLDGGHTTDSLKRKSWENSRVPFNNENNIKEIQDEKNSFDFSSIPKNAENRSEANEVLKTFPFRKTMTCVEPIVSLNTDTEYLQQSPVSTKSEKLEKENIVSKKWKNFKKDHFNDGTKIGQNYLKGNERIIVGGESANNSLREIKEKLPKGILEKFEDKSKEVLKIIFFNDCNILICDKVS